jgi:hypothetical protein
MAASSTPDTAQTLSRTLESADSPWPAMRLTGVRRATDGLPTSVPAGARAQGGPRGRGQDFRGHGEPKLIAAGQRTAGWCGRELR